MAGLDSIQYQHHNSKVGGKATGRIDCRIIFFFCIRKVSSLLGKGWSVFMSFLFIYRLIHQANLSKNVQCIKCCRTMTNQFELVFLLKSLDSSVIHRGTISHFFVISHNGKPLWVKEAQKLLWGKLFWYIHFPY